MDTNLDFNQQSYDLYISQLDLRKSDKVILNGSIENAQSLFLRLIDGATTNINIISSQLEHYNTNNIIGAIKRAIGKSVEVKILLDGNNINRNNNFLQYCMKTKGCTVKVSPSILSYHILTRDSEAYRYCQNTNGHNAIACFNGPTIAKQSDDKIFNQSTYNNYKTYV